MATRFLRLSMAVACVFTVLVHAASAAGGLDVKYKFDIPAQSMSAALLSFSQQADLQVMTASADLRDVRSSGVRGERTAREALDALLAGTGLKFHVIAEHAVAVERAKGEAEAALGNTDAGLRLAQGEQASSTDEAAVGQADPEAQGTLQEIIVTAQKRKEVLKDVPISISVLRGGDLDRSTLKDITEALREVPGVVVAGDVNNHRITVRGVAAQAGFDPNAFYFDGVPLTGSIFFGDFNAYDMDRVEVLRGPQGTLYGASSQSGVVRVFTHDADLNRFDLKTRVLASSTDRAGGNYQGDMAVNIPLIEGKLAARAVVDYQNQSGWIKGPLGTQLNDAHLYNYRLKVNASPIDNLSIGFSANFSRNGYDYIDKSDNNRAITAILPEPTSFDFDMYSLKVDYDTSAFSVSNVVGYVDYKNLLTLDLGTYHVPEWSGWPFYVRDTQHNVSDELLFNSHPGSAWKWTVGAFYSDSGYLHWSDITVFPFITYSGAGLKSSALFGQIGRRFGGDHWEWGLGLRRSRDKVSVDNLLSATYHPRSTFDSTTPRGVLNWYPHQNVSLYASYAEGFRPGVLQSANSQEFPPANPDTLHNYEGGAKADLLDRRLSFDVAAYFMDWKDVQQQVLVPLVGDVAKNIVLNGVSASGLGVDFQTTVRPVSGLDLGLNFSWNDLTMDDDVHTRSGAFDAILYKEGDRLNGSSEWTAGASVDYELPFGATGYKGKFSVSGNYYSATETHAVGAPGTLYALGGKGNSYTYARAGLSLIAPAHWNAMLFVDNITNQYGKAEEGTNPELMLRIRPRTTGLQFEYR